MGTARVYKLRRKKSVNSFDPATYRSAGGLIQNVLTYGANEINVIVDKGDNSIASTLIEVLEYNGLKPKNYKLKNKKIKLYFTKEKCQKAAMLLNKIRNDRINLSSIDFYSDPPVATSVNGVQVPLEGYSRASQSDGNEGNDQYENLKSEKVDTSASDEKSSPNWILIGGIALVGVIVLLAAIKLLKK